ncbi:MAG: hypothetical protein E7Z78_08495 [Methanobrevibacter thaueri]|uniref:hypothetical protein n=1 Tax=Methanobrevibacter thaueri TaxID=190975 RepID=UPI0026EB770A|nr:hypothetical protein [Methanobrevibacter thaueri]MBE6496467.1 hypothetical protein [Methanobrevibacter thaueri]
MLDNKGSFYIIDAILAVILLLIVFLVINATITMPTHDYSYETRDIKTAQDIMELLSGKVDFEDESFISEISAILSEGENSKESIREVSKISKSKLDSYDLENYRLVETNVLNNVVLASRGDWDNAENISVATRTYGEYSFTLSTW